jgi:hypothetical protein
MRIAIGLSCAAFLLAGCANPKSPARNPPQPDKKKPQKTYITPDLTTVGRVEMVNPEAVLWS